MSSRVFFHIGLHKTATSFLRKEVFPKLGKVNFIRMGDIDRVIRRMAATDTTVYDRASAKEGIQRFIEDGANLISHDGLSGSPFLRYMNRSQTLERLHAIYPTASILVGIRAQVDIIWSLYRHHVRQGGTRQLDEVIAPVQALGLYDRLDLETFKYSTYLRAIEDLFGRENMHVMVFEELVLDQDGFLAGIAQFIGCDLPREVKRDRVNVGISGQSLPLRRFLNRVFVMSEQRNFALIPRPPGFRRFLRVAARFLPDKEVDFKEASLGHLTGFYLEDNLYIDERYELGLGEHEYKSDKWLNGA